jgi:polyisoprenoid-binding protein YceI
MSETAVTSATTTAPTRRLNGTTLPAPGVWDIDPGHTEVAFVGRHFMVTKVRGRFTDVTGTVTVADDPEQSRLDVTIGMASVESGNATRDDHLRSSDLFDIEHHPQARFRSVAVRWSGSGGVIDGDLTIRGVTRRVPLQVTFEGYVPDPWGGHRAIYSARAQVNREDFGVTWNMALETGGLLVSTQITIEIELETVLRAG